MRKTPIEVRELDLPVEDLPDALAGLRIAHVSDFHFRRWNAIDQSAQDILTTGDFDFIVATGDFCTRLSRWKHAAALTRRFFEPIVDRTPVYAVLGNHDHPELPGRIGLPIRFLRDESAVVWHGGEALEWLGVEQIGLPPGNVAAAWGAKRQAKLTVLLAHFPSTVYHLTRGRVDIQLSGHTHGGQIRFPVLGCIFTNDRIPRRMARGLHYVEEVLVHVSQGIGTSPPLLIRMNCPPEITVLTLRPTESENAHSIERAVPVCAPDALVARP